MKEWTHVNEQGRARMVDVSEKKETVRTAVAHSEVKVSRPIYEGIENQSVKKGDVLAVAQVAGVMAAKKTPDWIPMCHTIPLSGVDIRFHWETEKDFTLVIEAEAKTKAVTGVEMEALTAASAAALTVYDMCKALDKGMVIGPTYLVEKTGGKSGDYRRTDETSDGTQ
ncbi:MAG TPA: cyclic pyranopterin monophosphate synthase MoaC [Bacillales bacterium]|nr:cyclic pyranopterin monophosphate synthase MoaC [Bacillales bacterium]